MIFLISHHVYNLAICVCHEKILYLEQAFLDCVFSSIEIDMQLLAQQNQMVFFLELRNYPQVSWLSYINKNPPVLKKKTTPGASGAEHGNAKGVADDRQGPLRCFR